MKVFKWILRILPLFYMGAIWVMSSLPSNHFVELPDSALDRTIKESLHLIEFAILYVLLVLAFLTRRSHFTMGLNVLCAVLAGLYGLTDEIHQSFYAYRSASWFDLVKDVTGILVCFYFIRGALFKGRFMGLGKILGFVRKLQPLRGLCGGFLMDCRLMVDSALELPCTWQIHLSKHLMDNFPGFYLEKCTCLSIRY